MIFHAGKYVDFHLVGALGALCSATSVTCSRGWCTLNRVLADSTQECARFHRVF